ncbi:hypothetical protein JCM21900_000562 [Sporobolomyces salmonicolor]
MYKGMLAIPDAKATVLADFYVFSIGLVTCKVNEGTYPILLECSTLKIKEICTQMCCRFAGEQVVLSTLKAADVDLNVVYSSHLLAALPPVLDSLQTTISISNPVAVPNTGALLELIRNEILRSSASPSSPAAPHLRVLATPVHLPRSTALGHHQAFGSLCIQLHNGRTVTIKNALLIEGLSTVLISSGQLWDLHGVATHFAEHATLTRNGTVVATGSRTKGSLYLLDGFRYVVTFVDDFSRRLWAEPLDRKSDDFEAFKRFKAAAETESGRKLQRFHSDNGGEYSSLAFCAYLDKHGVAFESPPPYSPASNGVAEPVNRSILEGIRAMLLQASTDESLWAEALLAFLFVKNHSPHATLNSKVPLAVWRGRLVRVDMLCVWGCRAWHTFSKTKSKLDARAVPLVFVGYDGDTRAYRLLNPQSKRIIRSRDTRFQEPLASASPPATVDAITPNPPAALANDSPLGVTVTCPLHLHGCLRLTSLPHHRPQPVLIHDAAPSPASPDLIDFLSDPFAAQAVTLTATIEDDMRTYDEAFSLPSRDHRNHREALTDVDSAGWLDGEKGEFLSLLNDYKVFHPVDRSPVPPTAKILGGRFNYRHKGYGKTQGYNQRPGLDFRETFAPVAKFASIRVLLALAAQQCMHIQQADIDKAYLHADLNEELYILKQAGRAWNAKIHATLERLGYCRTISDICVYVRREGGNYHYIALYVNDLLFLSHSQSEIDRVKGGAT